MFSLTFTTKQIPKGIYPIMTSHNFPRAHFIWGTILSERGPTADYKTFYPLHRFRHIYERCNFTPVLHPEAGPTFIYWEENLYFAANRRANKFLRPTYKDNYV